MQNLLTLAALGFAAARVTQLVVHDSILDGWRDRLELWHAAKFDSGIRTFFRTLLGCVYCVGFHAAWLTVLAFRLATGQGIQNFGDFLVFGIESFAVAGIAMIINRVDDTLPVR